MENNMYYIFITSAEKHTNKLHIMLKLLFYQADIIPLLI